MNATQHASFEAFSTHKRANEAHWVRVGDEWGVRVAAGAPARVGAEKTVYTKSGARTRVHLLTCVARASSGETLWLVAGAKPARTKFVQPVVCASCRACKPFPNCGAFCTDCAFGVFDVER